jgi:hypothetical protein
MTVTDTTTQIGIVDILSDAYAKLNRIPLIILIPLVYRLRHWSHKPKRWCVRFNPMEVALLT